MVAQQLVDTAPAQEEPQCYLVTAVVDFESFTILKGFDSESAAEVFRAAAEAYHRTAPEWPADSSPDEEYERFHAAHSVWLRAHPGGLHASGAHSFGIISAPYVTSTDQPNSADVSAVLVDQAHLVRELDVLLNGEAGAAQQASLCDIVAQLRSWLVNPVAAKSPDKMRRKRKVQSPAPTGAGRPAADITKEVVILETKDGKGVDLWISDWDGIFMLDCGFDRHGFKAFGELPRVYRTERGARQAAALLTGEKLKWTNVVGGREL